MGMQTQDWLKISPQQIARIVDNYDKDKLTEVAIGSHSALDVCDGTLALSSDDPFSDMVIKNLVLAKKGRHLTYAELYKREERPRKNGKTEFVGVVEECWVQDNWSDFLKPEFQEKVRDKNGILIPSRSTEVYWKYPAIGSYYVPLFGQRALLPVEERNGPFKPDKNQDYLVDKAGINHPIRFKVIDDADIPVIIKATSGIGPRDFERRFPRIYPKDGIDIRDQYEEACTAYINSEINAYNAHLKKEEGRTIAQSEINQLKQRLDDNFREATIEELLPGTELDDLNFNFFYSPTWDKLELIGIDMRGKLASGEERSHQAASLRESLIEEAYNMGRKYLEIVKEEYGISIIGPFALQCRYDKNDKASVLDVSMRIPGSPDTPLSPNAWYQYPGIPRLSFGLRIAKEITYACEQGQLEKVLS